MTDIDAIGARSPRSPGSPGGRSASASGTGGSYTGRNAPGHSGHATANMVCAGVPSGGTKDLATMEPRNPSTPHKSLVEFSLKKQQHFAAIHSTPHDPRFRV